MSPWKVQYSICNYYGDKDTVLYVSSHREKTEAVAIATARRALNKSTNSIAQDFSRGAIWCEALKYKKVVLLKFLRPVLECRGPKYVVKTSCCSPPLCFKVGLAQCAKELSCGSWQPENFICAINFQEALTAAQGPRHHSARSPNTFCVFSFPYYTNKRLVMY